MWSSSGRTKTSREKYLGATGSVRAPNVRCPGEEALEIDGNSGRTRGNRDGGRPGVW